MRNSGSGKLFYLRFGKVFEVIKKLKILKIEKKSGKNLFA